MSESKRPRKKSKKGEESEPEATPKQVIDFCNEMERLRGQEGVPFFDFFTATLGNMNDELESWLNKPADEETKKLGKSLKTFMNINGSLVSIWDRDDDDAKSLLDMPIVMMSTEGAYGVIAKNFASFVWLIALGLDDIEYIIEGGTGAPERRLEELVDYAKQHFPRAEKPWKELIQERSELNKEFRGIIREMMGLEEDEEEEEDE